MSYTTGCDMEGCETTGTVPGTNERVARGTQMYRTVSDEYMETLGRSNFADDPEERAKAEKRLEHIAKWAHYCPEHAVALGIAPSHAALDVRYLCEECGHESDTHSAKPSGHGGPTPACEECGATALSRFKADTEEAESR